MSKKASTLSSKTQEESCVYLEGQEVIKIGLMGQHPWLSLIKRILILVFVCIYFLLRSNSSSSLDSEIRILRNKFILLCLNT